MIVEREREMTTTESMFDSMNRMIQREREGEKFENKIQLIQFCLMHQKLNKINKNVWSVFFLLGNFPVKKLPKKKFDIVNLSFDSSDIC